MGVSHLRHPRAAQRGTVEVHYTCWSLETTGAFAAVHTEPLEVEKVHREDGSGSILVRSGKQGAVLQSASYPPGRFPLVYGGRPPDGAAAIRTYLGSRTGRPLARPEDYLDAAIDLRSEWPLSDLQCVTILELLMDQGGVTMEGAVNDRLGRAGVAVSVSTGRPGNYRALIVFDKASGQLLEADTVSVAGSIGTRIPMATVVSYVAWR
jgi:hypothetical protein